MTATSATSAPSARATRAFWPVAEAAQADYELLRAVVLSCGSGGRGSSDQPPPPTIAAARFERRGLAGLIAWPAAEPVWCASVVGAVRPPWTPHADPRLDALATGFAFLLAPAARPTEGDLTAVMVQRTKQARR